jgi:peptidoglycan hydrolase-like protein with peptidoglycan-binding domain
MPNFATLQVKEIQLRLHHLGFDPGTIDGAWGRRTQAAVRKFQSSNGLVADGIVGPKTYSALLQGKMPSVNTTDDVALVWFQEARRLKGIREILGAQSNSIILNWADDLGIAYSGDDVPWCGLFTAHCIGATLVSEL